MKANFCRKINELGAAKNISIDELARRSGLPLNMLEALERGEIPKEMVVDDAFALARVFQCKAHELFR